MPTHRQQHAGVASALHDRISTALAAGGADLGRRKATGAVYTPQALAHLVVERSFAALGRTPDLILDPACGTGHFLVAAWHALRADWRGGPPPIARLCGIELDHAAAEAAREVLEACAELDRLELGTRKAKPRVLTADALTAGLPELEGACDLVVGNPPYVRIDRLEPRYRAELVERFGPWLSGKWDLYYCFLARALDFLAPEGVLGFVTPNQFFLGRSARLLRGRLATRTSMHDIIDLCGLEPFDRAIPPAAVTVLKKEEPAPDHRVKLQVCLPGRTDLAEALRTGMSGEVCQERWREGTWSVLAPEPFMRWLDALDAPRLGDLAVAISEGDTRRSEEACIAPAAAAPVDWWPVVRGRDVSRAGVHLAGGSDRLPPGRSEAGQGRILIRDVAPRLVAALDPGLTRCLRTVYCVYPRDPAIAAPLVHLLNSDLLSWLYIRLFYSSKMSPRAANFRFQSQYLAALPILLPPGGMGEEEGEANRLEEWALDAYKVPSAERSGVRSLLARLGALSPAAKG